jgi:hypothetical protein
MFDSDRNLRYWAHVRTLHGDRLLALALGAILVFFAQSLFCLAEPAGLIGCPVEVEQHQSSAGSEKPSNPHCCHADSHNAITTRLVGVPAAALFGKISLKSDTSAPEGPVRAIEHPPQFS